MTDFTPTPSKRPVQPPIDGAIYIISVSKFVKERTLFPKTGIVAYVMERSLSVDVDNEQDLRWAEWLLTNGPKST